MRFVKMMAVATVAATMAVSSAANAAPVITVAQVGTSVVVTTTGTLNITGLTVVPTSYILSLGASPTVGYVATGLTPNAPVTAYTGFAGPMTFGTGGYLDASSGTGVSFAINSSSNASPYVFVTTGFVSGSSVAGTATFLNQTLASLGFTTGTYSYRSANDTLTVIVGPSVAAVPEPATWALMLAGFGAVGFAMRRRQKVRVAFA